MITIKVTDMHEAQSIAQDFDLVVSIHDWRFKEFFNLGKDKHFISKFDDTEHPDETDWIRMNTEVRSILSWIKSKNISIDDDTKILVHCHAGISRSSAIAWLIMVMLGEDPLIAIQMLLKARPQIWPNKQVLAIGSSFLNLDPSFMKLASQVDAEIAMKRDEFLGYGG